MEEYSPYFNKHLEDCNFHDAGDLEFPLGNTQGSLDLIEKNVREIYKDGKRVFGIGGEHLVTLPEIQAVSEFSGNLSTAVCAGGTDRIDGCTEYLLWRTACDAGSILCGFQKHFPS